MNSRIKLILIALLVTCVSCAPNRIYRTDYGVCTGNQLSDCDTHAVVNYQLDKSSAFHLGYVEYDDQGQLRDREQMRHVIDYFYQVAAQREVIVTVFVHGWHHSASQEDSNVASYKQLLSQIARNEATISKNMNTKPRAVMGIYVGWRGDSITIPYVNVATFWNRKKVAQDVGLQGVTEVLLRLEQLVNTKIAQGSETGEQNSKMISIGHSFGGAVLYTSIQQLMADRFFNSDRRTAHQSDAEGFGDLVLLVNPAFEALRFATLYDISQDGCRRYFASQLPKLAILTSEKDYATRIAFPAGRLVTSVTKTYKPLPRYDCTQDGKASITLSEREADRVAVGHYKPFQTHLLTPTGAEPADKDSMAYFQNLQQEWKNLTYGDTMSFDAVSLKHLGKTTPHNPYLNIYVDGEIIPSHNDIWRPELVHFVEDLVMITSSAQMLNTP